jgi:hypothetical protein
MLLRALPVSGVMITDQSGNLLSAWEALVSSTGKYEGVKGGGTYMYENLTDPSDTKAP